MKMNRFTLSEADTAHLLFESTADGYDYQVKILVVETEPQAVIERDGAEVFNETLKSVDDLKIFLEERLYHFLKV